ncbi:ABC transporter permease [Phycicoccus duodecadis]|uniref:Xylose transport system permease protein XylH n=1 Tax=Phycicoccus duodecadis TaxID=173053 RepID=A0A2N3YM06_9MICO|nr:ABC transporter permease [Phycicoccus duodecadis]PKW27890.1 monosaccharide ABC transporter membrane protein (CUT2 family) [Phycicoccus duodecadis]
MSTTTAPAATGTDERLVAVSRFTRVLRRPELGALLGAIVIYVMFALVDTTGVFVTIAGTARWTDVAASVGIVAVPVALLMISGEFDLSAGVMVGTSGLFAGLLTTQYGFSMWPAIGLTLLFAAGIGLVNGWLVMLTGLPSFIVTLAMFFSLRGINLGVTKMLTDTVRVAGIDKVPGYDSAASVFASTFWAPYDFRTSVLWWLAITVVATTVLTKLRFGNWVYAVGGDQTAARNTGVPVRRTKIAMFVCTSLAAALVGIITLLRLKSMQAGQGVGEEFTFIIAAVVGGCLLTGGFGSAIGASIGASIIGMAFIGIAYAGWNTDWSWLFLGVILFIAVLVNTFIGRRAQGARK